jgi:hypothetical protein
VLGPSTDERDELEDDLTVVEGVPFIASESFLDQYGSVFKLLFEEGRLMVQPVDQPHPDSCLSCS